ncbi:hypothetical protein [Echinicola rosea]|uniref:hypothetical protein n=1 Tax=Echinicola rosea TaxID=1807691 RepID=UPI0010CA90A3|nr:hypothetical protein [Echinicola rosea]
MKELSLERMENIRGGINDHARCFGGIAATVALGATAFFAPAAFMGVLMTGPGLQAVASVSAAAGIAIYEGC